MTKYIRYTKYTGEPADGVDLQELVKRLSDFFLQSGYESQFYGLSEMDAYELLSQVGEIHLNEMVDPNYVVVAKVKKKFLPSVKAASAK